jgi:phosphopantetheine--protein transferase-like protein
MAELKNLPDRQTLSERITLNVGVKREAWSRMREEQSRASMAGILLLETALCEQGINLDGLTVLREPSGRPYLEGATLDFSISHTDSLAVCAVDFGANAVQARLGVDVERIDRSRDEASMLRIARRWFSEGEIKLLEKAPTEETFLRIWTAKEAIVKRTGEGLCAARSVDTTAEQKDRKLTVYRTDTAILTLCHRADREAPTEIIWIR